jgi:hypothetical protein
MPQIVDRRGFAVPARDDALVTQRECPVHVGTPDLHDMFRGVHGLDFAFERLVTSGTGTVIGRSRAGNQPQARSGQESRRPFQDCIHFHLYPPVVLSGFDINLLPEIQNRPLFKSTPTQGLRHAGFVRIAYRLFS